MKLPAGVFNPGKALLFRGFFYPVRHPGEITMLTHARGPLSCGNTQQFPSPGRVRLARAESDSFDSCPKKDRQAEHRSCSRSPQVGR